MNVRSLIWFVTLSLLGMASCSQDKRSPFCESGGNSSSLASEEGSNPCIKQKSQSEKSSFDGFNSSEQIACDATGENCYDRNIVRTTIIRNTDSDYDQDSYEKPQSYDYPICVEEGFSDSKGQSYAYDGDSAQSMRATDRGTINCLASQSLSKEARMPLCKIACPDEDISDLSEGSIHACEDVKSFDCRL